VLVGVNDTLRGRFELAAIAADLEEVVMRLRDAGAIVLTASLPDPGLMLGVPELVRRPLARRVHAINAIVARLASRYDAVHIDLAGHPALYDRRMWGVDRLHPSERGHRLLAGLFAGGLADHGVPLRALPGQEPTGAQPTALAGALWMATKGTGWVVRRARDFLPTLTRLVLDEWWHEVRSEGSLLEARLSAELDGVLARVGVS
jgi:hypothetical protein